jgi:hypothetical protein
MQRISIKKYFLFTMGSTYLSRKSVHNWVEKFTDDARPGAEGGETTVKTFLCRGLRRAGKMMQQMYRVVGGYAEK